MRLIFFHIYIWSALVYVIKFERLHFRLKLKRARPVSHSILMINLRVNQVEHKMIQRMIYYSRRAAIIKWMCRKKGLSVKMQNGTQKLAHDKIVK